ncbi:MAG: sulfatase family protein [Promethearchaeota archaeon]
MVDKKPNIVYVMADDLGYGDLGCYGATKIETPHADKIAAEGMKFTDAHSSSAVCTPSRYSVLTGRYCWRTELKRWVMGGYGYPLIEKGRPTIASFLRGHGYRSAAVGKWHVGLGWQLNEGAEKPTGSTRNKIGMQLDVDFTKKIKHGPLDLGFDYFFGIAGSLDMDPYCFIENDKTVGIPSVPKEPRYNQQRDGLMVPGWKDEDVDIQHAAKAVGFIKDHVERYPNKPFFLYIATSAPHRPCDCQPPIVRGRSKAGDRGDMVMMFDWVVGQIDSALDALGIADDTLTILTSDNGARLRCANGNDYGHKSCGNLRGQKADIWDGGHREPFIARWPGRVKPGSVSHDLVCLMDLFGTVADVVGSQLPDDGAEDTFSFFDSLTGEETSAAPHRNKLIHHSGNGYFSLRMGKWKLIKGLGSGGFSRPRFKKPRPWGPRGQLYDLDTDLQETTNLWKQRTDIVKRFNLIIDECITDGRTRPLEGRD